MSNKTEDAYDDVLSYIHRNVMNLTCAKFTTDYEVAMRNALQKISPGAQLVACWFHYCQAVKRYATKIAGFMQFLQSDAEAKVIFEQMLCLPLLPPEYILPTFKTLKEKAFAINKKAFSKFFVYYQRQWLVRESILSLIPVFSFLSLEFFDLFVYVYICLHRKAPQKLAFLDKIFAQPAVLKHTTDKLVIALQSMVISFALLSV